MKTIILICIVLSIISCNQSSLSETKDDTFPKVIDDNMVVKQDTVKLILAKNLDRIVIEYWDNINANTFVFVISNDSDITFYGEEVSKEIRHINSIAIHNHIVASVNRFYINKEEKIVLKRSKRNYLKSSEYPDIRVIGYREGKEVFNKHTQIGNEEYDLEFNPKFIAFYELLSGLIR